MDYAFLIVDSVFTVGVVEELDPALTRVMAATLKHSHKIHYGV